MRYVRFGHIACDYILQKLFALVMDQEGFQSSLDKLIDGLLYFSPVGALIFKHHAVDRKASVHLKIKDSFRLFKGQEAVFHQARNEILLAEICQLSPASGRHATSSKNST